MDFNYQCIECRKCEENCSIFIATGKYSPVEKLKIIDELRNDIEIDAKKIQAIFNCTKCEACQNNCPQEIPLIELYDWARHKIKTSHGLRNKKQLYLIQNIVNSGNPFGSEESRLKGAPLELVENKIDKQLNPSKPKILLHLGCMLGYRLNSMRDDVLKIFNLLDINYNLLGDESCCGYFVWNTGDHETAEKIIKKNSEDFKNYDKIICACAGCYTFFKEHYPEKDKFYHSIEMIDDTMIKLNKEGRLRSKIVNKTPDRLKIFHDSCHLTRPHYIVDPPRRILNLMGIEFHDYSHSGVEGLCCGADGGLRIINPELAVKIGRDRVKEAEDMNSDKIITLCPFCIFNFQDATSEETTVGVESLYHYIRTYLELNLEKSHSKY
jgi:fumarate reductase (CoM/CoB) subunit B